ncbi:MAG: VOC family protein [Steroidobacteraceae bacterium]
MEPAKNSPAGWPRISSGLYYRDPARMIDWLCNAFGFVVKLKVEGANGRIEHSELTYGDGMIMVGHERVGADNPWGADFKSPLSVGSANTQGLLVQVDDVDSHCARSRAAGAVIVDEPRVHDYGEEYWADRSYGARDPEGHLWWFTQRIRG